MIVRECSSSDRYQASVICNPFNFVQKKGQSPQINKAMEYGGSRRETPPSDLLGPIPDIPFSPNCPAITMAVVGFVNNVVDNSIRLRFGEF